MHYDYGRLPLDAHVHSYGVGTDSEVAIARAGHDAFEDHAAECMRRQGFDYTPRQYAVDGSTNPVDGKATVSEQRAWVEEHGYGISTLIDLATTARSVLDADGFAGAGEASPDPNAAYLASLDPHEHDAYWEAFGDYQTGCSAAALEPAEAARRQATLELNRTESDYINERFYAALRETEAYEEAHNHWRGCMRERGWPHGDHLEATEDVAARLSDLANRVSALNEPLDPAGLAELQAYERALAGDDLECHLTEVFVRQRRIEAEIQATIMSELSDRQRSPRT